MHFVCRLFLMGNVRHWEIQLENFETNGTPKMHRLHCSPSIHCQHSINIITRSTISNKYLFNWRSSNELRIIDSNWHLNNGWPVNWRQYVSTVHTHKSHTEHVERRNLFNTIIWLVVYLLLFVEMVLCARKMEPGGPNWICYCCGLQQRDKLNFPTTENARLYSLQIKQNKRTKH